MKSADDRGAGDEPGTGSGFIGDVTGDLGGAADRRQRLTQLLQTEQPQRLGRITLSAYIGEGCAGFGTVGADRSGQAEAQPVFAGKGVGDAPIAVRLVGLDPGEQGRGCRGMRHLTGQLQRRVGDRAFGPGVDDIAGAAVEGEDGGAERAVLGVEQVDAVAMRGRRHAGDVLRRPSAPSDGFADGLGGGTPEALHVAFDVTRLRDRLRYSSPGDCELGAVGVEDDRFGDRQPVVDPEQAWHGDALSRVWEVEGGAIAGAPARLTASW